MKKFLSMITVVFVLVGVLSVCSYANTDENTANVFVTIADKGNFMLAYESITVTDSDDDGELTINDALYCAHMAKYNGGAEAGYGSYESDYGLSLGKLWGDTSGNFGYYLNNSSAFGLTDTVKDGDCVYALIYAGSFPELESFCYFDVNYADKNAGDTVELTLYVAGYDEEWNPISSPLENAVITVNGEPTAYKTAADGKVSLTIDKIGTLLISATSNEVSIAPPLCVINSKGTQPQETTDTQQTVASQETTDTQADTEQTKDTDGCKSFIGATSAFALTACLTTVALTVRRKNEK